MWGALSEEKSVVFSIIFLMDIANAVFLSSGHTDSWAYFIDSILRLPQSGGSYSSIYFPQEQSSPVILPGIGFV
jgi:hypothetical protein